MQFDIEIGGRTRQVAVTRVGSGFTVSVDGVAREVDVALIDGSTMSLLIGDRRISHEISILPGASPSRLTVRVGAALLSVGLNDLGGPNRKDSSGGAAAGPQRVVAAMPGKVVRVLAEPGAVVRAGQGLVVLEAMKMENELRAPRDGTVSAVHAREGVSVEAGALLVVIA